MKAPKIEIVDVPVDRIEPDPENVNEMDPAAYKALRAEIRMRGFVQPVLVREVPPHSGNPKIEYRIVDGEHRWMALTELGAETVPCVVAEADDTEATIRSLIMNGIRGSFVPIRLAHLLADLSDRVPSDELESRLALGKGELRDLLDLTGFADERDKPKPKDDDEDDSPTTVEVVVVATHEQAATIGDLLKAETGGDPERDAAVIARKAREFTSS